MKKFIHPVNAVMECRINGHLISSTEVERTLLSSKAEVCIFAIIHIKLQVWHLPDNVNKSMDMFLSELVDLEVRVLGKFIDSRS